MSVDNQIHKLLVDLHSVSKEIGRIESLQPGPRNAHNPAQYQVINDLIGLQLKRYAIEKDLSRAFEVREKMKTRFQRLFNK